MNQQQHKLNIDNLFQTISQKFGEIQLQLCILEGQLIEKEQELMKYREKEKSKEDIDKKEDKGE